MTCLCTAAVLSAAVSCHNGDRKEIPVSENTEADFGVIKEKDGPVSNCLLFTNSYPDTLLPVTALTRCSCVIADVEKTPVAPGETLRLNVTYNPAYKSGIFMEEVGVRCLGRKGILSFIIKGEVVPMAHDVSEDHPYDFGKGLHISHEVLHYGKLSPGEQAGMFIRCANAGRKRMKLGFEIPEDYRKELSFKDEHYLGKNGRDTIWFRFTMPPAAHAGDTVSFQAKVLVNGREADRPLTVKAVCRESRPI